jgi:3-methyladenine DNA glycosylase AlkD
MNITAIVQEIEKRADELPVRNVPALRALRREYSKRLRALPAEAVVKIAAALIGHGRVHRFVGDELIMTRADALRILDRAQLERLGTGMSSWDQVDCFASYLSGPAWRQGQIGDEAIAGWAKSKDRWWRRAALVSTTALNVKARGGSGDARRTLAVCRLLMDDRDDMVVKALSWSLRVLAPHDPNAVKAFLEQNEERLAALVLREVRRKLETGRKNRPRLSQT